jgi:hypothetical protein
MPHPADGRSWRHLPSPRCEFLTQPLFDIDQLIFESAPQTSPGNMGVKNACA